MAGDVYAMTGGVGSWLYMAPEVVRREPAVMFLLHTDALGHDTLGRADTASSSILAANAAFTRASPRKMAYYVVRSLARTGTRSTTSPGLQIKCRRLK